MSRTRYDVIDDLSRNFRLKMESVKILGEARQVYLGLESLGRVAERSSLVAPICQIGKIQFGDAGICTVGRLPHAFSGKNDVTFWQFRRNGS